MERCDLAIVGGGMVGALAAGLLAATGLEIRLIEARAPDPFDGAEEHDLRISAISAASVRLLQQAHAWEAVLAMRAWPYQGLEASEWQGFVTRFNAAELDAEYLGFMVENRVLQLALWQALAGWQNVVLECPNGLTALRQRDGGAELTLSDGRQLHARLVLACDGAESRTRQFAHIGITAWDYAQHCMLINVRTGDTAQDTTWQQFHPSGPRAFLPLGDNRASLVWYDARERITQLAAMSHEQLTEQIHNAFPARLGSVGVLNKGHFPLRRRHANEYAKGSVVLLGDAAHTINPLAGQGVNLGFKDVALLSELIHQAVEGGRDFTAPTLLAEYSRRRRPDNLLMQSMMDVFYAGFSNDVLPLKLLRNLGLKAAEHSGPLKAAVMKYAMGL